MKKMRVLPRSMSGSRQTVSPAANATTFWFGNQQSRRGWPCVDLWMYDHATSQWSRMGGSSTVSDPGDYGRQGSPAIGNVPPSRSRGISWIDAQGDRRTT